MFAVLAYVSTTPRPNEEFFQLYVLGADHKLEHYYPNDDPSIVPNSTVQWYVGVTNSMASVQYVVVKLKLGNATIPAPNETIGAPSPAPLLAQYSRVLLVNETWEFLVNWEVAAENRTGSAISVNLNLNGTNLAMANPMNQNGQDYRIIIELWVFNPATGGLQFGWVRGSLVHADWLQVWFSVASG